MMSQEKNSKAHLVYSGSPPGHRLFYLISSIFVLALVLSNVVSQKLISVGPFVFAGGVILFPVTYIFGDILTEVYGYHQTRKIIWLGFFANVFMAGVFYAVIWLKPAPGWPFQNEFEIVLKMVPRIIFASILAYWVGEFLNSYVMSRLKESMDGKKLYIRTISSTIVGQAADTFVFVLIAFYNVVPLSILITTMWSGYLFKVFYEVVATPITILIVNKLKSIEEVDVYDRDLNRNPFLIRDNQ